MGIATRRQRAYRHHTETQAVIKSHVIYSHIKLLNVMHVCTLWFSHTQINGTFILHTV